MTSTSQPPHEQHHADPTTRDVTTPEAAAAPVDSIDTGTIATEPPGASAPGTDSTSDAASEADTLPETIATEAPPAPDPVAELTDELAAVRAELADTQARLAEMQDNWLRAKAETENVRRRAQEDISKANRFAAEKFAGAMLPVHDSLEAALGTENQTLENLREGVELTLKQLDSAFAGAGVIQEDPSGGKFDPNRHQAISAVPSEAPANTVINVLQKGYLLHERVLRPALVVVAQGN